MSNISSATGPIEGKQECAVSLDFGPSKAKTKKSHPIVLVDYRKTPKIWDTRKFAIITLKVEQDGFSLE